jgi:protein O-mannosyl-transferase
VWDRPVANTRRPDDPICQPASLGGFCETIRNPCEGTDSVVDLTSGLPVRRRRKRKAAKFAGFLPVSLFPPASPAPSFPDSKRIGLAVVLIAIVAAAAYFNSFRAVFVYDDVSAIVENQSIHTWRHWREWFLGAQGNGLPTGGRPLVQLSLALNFAIGGTSVAGYHVVNFAIHLAAALALFGCVRRTSRLPHWQGRFGTRADAFALAVALVWVAHPLATETVTYIVQRAEGLMAFFYLLTLYGFIRAAERPASWSWSFLAIAACWAGMATKEVMVSAPLIVLLFDRTFIAGSFGAALRTRWRFYGAVALSWVLLVWLVVNTAGRGGTAGFDAPVAWPAYALTQFGAIAHYLRLALWPYPLVFDYGIVLAHGFGDVAAAATLVAILGLATMVALVRRLTIGFLGACFFATIAPSSSVVPIATETMAEHRMYLPLAAVVLVLVSAIHAVIGRRITLFIAAIVLPLVVLTESRNTAYRNEHTLWADTIAKRPNNARAHFNFGAVLAAGGNLPAAESEYQTALRLKPGFASAEANLADVYFQLGKLTEAEQHATTALQVNPTLAEARATLGNVRFQQGRIADALADYEAAVKLRPQRSDLHLNVGAALSQLGRLADALPHYEKAVRLEPGSALAHFQLGNTFARLSRFDEAVTEYEAALQLRPEYREARDNLARVRALRPAPALSR